MKKLVVDKSVCIGCGTCQALAPKVFKVGDDGKAYTIDHDENDEESAQNAIESCPVQAISWKE